MTQVVKGIGDAISGVVKGVVDVVGGVVKGVGDVVKSIADSPIGKAILIAGAIYFGGAALMGGFGSSAAGGSFLSGMGAGIESAATSLSGAWGSIMSGNIGEAAGTISNAWGTAGTAAGEAATAAQAAAAAAPGALTTSAGAMPPAPGATPPVPGAAPAPIANAPLAPAPGQFSLGYQASGMPPPTAQIPFNGMQFPNAAVASNAIPPVAPAATGWWAGLDPYMKTAAVMGGTQVAGGLIAGAGQAKAQQEARDYEYQQQQNAIAMRNANVGARINFAPFVTTAYAQPATPGGIINRYVG